MVNDLIITLIDFVEILLLRMNITRLIDNLGIAINTAITALPRLVTVLGYVSYFVDWTLLLPLIILAGVTLMTRVGLALYNAVAQIIP